MAFAVRIFQSLVLDHFSPQDGLLEPWNQLMIRYGYQVTPLGITFGMPTSNTV